MQTRLAGILGVLIVACALVLSGCGRTGEADADAPPIKVGAIFAVTGPASFLGAPAARTVEMFVGQLNEAGGIDGRRIQLLVRDSAGSPERALSLAKQLIDEEQVLAILGPSTSGESMHIKQTCQEGETILLSCAAAETIVNPVASYVFKTPQNDSDAVRRIYQTMRDLDIERIGVVASSDGFGAAGSKQLAHIAPEYGITIAGTETYSTTETDLTAVLTKIMGLNVQAVVNWSIVPAQALVARNMRQIGLDVPLFQSHGFGNIRYVEAGGEATEGTIFPCGRLLVAELLPDDHPQKEVLLAYKRDYESRYKEEASTFGGHAYDAILILVEGIRKAGSTDRAAVRDAIENLQGVVGTGGIFNFSPQDHCGLDQDAFEMLTVRDGRFAIYQR